MEQSELVSLLKDPLVETRLRAARALTEMKSFDKELFLLALGDVDWRVRKEAISFYVQQADKAAHVELVIDQLSHPDNAGLRNAAIEILIGLGASVSKILLLRLESADAELRKFIVDILGEVCPANCVVQLLPYLQDDDENVRYAVVETLGKLGSIEAVGSLLDLLELSEAGLQFAVFEALTAIGEGVPAKKIIPYAENTLLRKSVLNCLGQLSDVDAIPTLLKGLSDPMRKNREVALLAFGQLIKSLKEKDCPAVNSQSDQVVEQLFGYLQHENLAYRKAACYVLSLFPSVDVVSNFLPLLAEDELRADVVAAAKLVPEAIWAATVAETTLDDANALYLIYLLGELECPQIEPLATTGLQSDDPQFRYVSVATLGKICALEQIALIGDVMVDEVADVREAASEALCRIGRVDSAGVLKTVTPYLEAVDADLRLLAVKTLAGLATASVEQPLLLSLKDADEKIRCEALRGLTGFCSARLFAGLSLSLTDESAAVRRLAAAAIGRFPAEEATPILLHALDDSDPWVRMEVLRSLAGGDEATVETMIARGLADRVGVVVIAALEAAQRLQSAQLESQLREALQHPDRDICSTAVHLLFSAGTASELLTNPRLDVRLLAVQEFKGISDPQTLLLLEDRLDKEPDAQVRQAIEAVLRNDAAGN